MILRKYKIYVPQESLFRMFSEHPLAGGEASVVLVSCDGLAEAAGKGFEDPFDEVVVVFAGGAEV